MSVVWMAEKSVEFSLSVGFDRIVHSFRSLLYWKFVCCQSFILCVCTNSSWLLLWFLFECTFDIWSRHSIAFQLQWTNKNCNGKLLFRWFCAFLRNQLRDANSNAVSVKQKKNFNSCDKSNWLAVLLGIYAYSYME